MITILYNCVGLQALKAGLRIGSESLKTRLRQFRGIQDPARLKTFFLYTFCFATTKTKKNSKSKTIPRHRRPSKVENFLSLHILIWQRQIQRQGIKNPARSRTFFLYTFSLSKQNTKTSTKTETIQKHRQTR